MSKHISIAVITFISCALALVALGAINLLPLAAAPIFFGALLTSILVTLGTLGMGAWGGDKQKSGSAGVGDFSDIDPLTRTMNRRGITIGLMDAMAMGERYGNPLSVVKLDIDQLSKINVKMGTGAGDRVLVTVAAVIADALRMPDKVGRLSDDEFVLVMPETDLEDAYNIADRLRSLIADRDIDVDGESTKITISVGVTQYTQGEDLEGLLTRVQEGVDTSREAGRNRVTRV